MLAMKQISAPVGGQAGIQVETEENRMEQSVEKIIERNLLEVFNGRDADSRRAAIDELWNKDGGPPDDAQRMTGTDVGVTKDGKLTALYVFIDPPSQK
jgi:hypothetical protein